MSRLAPRLAQTLGFSLVVVLFGTLGRTGRAQEKVETAEPPLAVAANADAPAKKIPPVFVFVADGAGGYLHMSRHLGGAAEQEGVPVQIVTCDWSHGPSRYLADHFLYNRAKREAGKMATVIQDYRRQYPDPSFHVVGHSAGVGVALTALESLPPNTVDKAYLISPSVSADYDIRPALKAVKEHLYVHYSSRDWFWMGVATRVAGNTDRRWGRNSGRFGFRIYIEEPELKDKLVQRNWEPGDRVTGNNGGHFGGYEMEFLRQQVVPWLAKSAKTTGSTTAQPASLKKSAPADQEK